ncbi:MAG: DUF1287 domain-containing protein [Lachnospiraceae bacterium]
MGMRSMGTSPRNGGESNTCFSEGSLNRHMLMGITMSTGNSNSGRKDYSWDFSGKGSGTRRSATGGSSGSSYGSTGRGAGQGYSYDFGRRSSDSKTTGSKGRSAGSRTGSASYGSHSVSGSSGRSSGHTSSGRRPGTGSSSSYSSSYGRPSGYTGSRPAADTAKAASHTGSGSGIFPDTGQTAASSAISSTGSDRGSRLDRTESAGRRDRTESAGRRDRFTRRSDKRSASRSGKSLPVQYKIMRFARRNKKFVAAASVVVLLLLVFVVKGAFFKSDDDTKQAVAPGQTAASEQAKTEAAAGDMTEAPPQTEAQTKAAAKANDADGDGITDQEDILQGAKDYVATKPQYKSKYYSGGYPDDEYGVCTDVVAYGFLAAGYDLRELVDADIAESPESYKLEDAPDPNIDFRRVKNLKVYFDRHAESLTTDIYDFDEWQGGDIVTFAAHIGIVSDKRGEDGVNLLIHHGYKGQKDYENDWLSNADDITGHYRVNYGD